MNKTTKNQIYFYLILVMSIIWLFAFAKPIRNFAPIIFIIPTFPVFMFNYYNELLDFSNKLKTLRPDLFQKHVVDYGISLKGKIVYIGVTSTINDFESLEDFSLRENYILCKQLIRLALISFIIFPLLGIGTIYL